MSVTIDLANLPNPSVIEELSAEVILAELQAELIALYPQIEPVLQLESAIVNKLMQAFAFRETLIRARENDAARALMLAKAVRSDLDAIGANFGVGRLVVEPASPGKAPVMEDDERFRRRIQTAQAAYSVAGPADAYVFHAMTAVPAIADVTATKTGPGKVLVTVMMPSPNVVPSSAVLHAVDEALSSASVRPLTDMVVVRPASVVNVNVVAELTLYPGPNAAFILSNARAALKAFLNANCRLGRDLRLSAIYSRLHAEGVQSVKLLSPSADVVIDPTQVYLAAEPSIAVVGRDE